MSDATTTSLSPAIAPKSGALTLKVLTGIQQGVLAQIAGETCTIGSLLASDLVFADNGVAPEHLHLRFYGRQVAIDAIGGDVAIENHPVLKCGHGCRARLPVTLQVGDTKFRITRNGVNGAALKRWGAYAGMLAVAVAIVPVFTVRTGFSGLLHQPSAPQSDDLTVGSIPVAPSAQSDGEILRALRDRLDKADLGKLSLSADGRHIIVSGQVRSDRMNDWRDIQQWFDRSHGGRYVLTSDVSAAAAAAPPRFVLQAVFFGKNPYVIDAKGERRYPGAALEDGWTLKSIEDRQIVVLRGGQEFTFSR